ncbi:hypothetical protein [uncultured Leifsonia sp.]|uniref:hypothetical protein n=1 Tax=uncultured Leifsonia sp. TaxID=340359 RepID=UPI0028D1FA37|nr:hypothetical protein [uncultured Leifsonia sp.]
MSAVPALRTAEDCLRRAVSMKESALGLAERDDEWFAVCYFYSAYHTVKAAFIEDPIFDDIQSLSAVDRFLIMDDRYATSHHGRVSAHHRRHGVNDIVSLLYPGISVEYVRLHMASIAVRYSSGLGVIRSESVKADYAHVVDQYASGAVSFAEE